MSTMELNRYSHFSQEFMSYIMAGESMKRELEVGNKPSPLYQDYDQQIRRIFHAFLTPAVISLLPEAIKFDFGQFTYYDGYATDGNIRYFFPWSGELLQVGYDKSSLSPEEYSKRVRVNSDCKWLNKPSEDKIDYRYIPFGFLGQPNPQFIGLETIRKSVDLPPYVSLHQVSVTPPDNLSLPEMETVLQEAQDKIPTHPSIKPLWEDLLTQLMDILGLRYQRKEEAVCSNALNIRRRLATLYQTAETDYHVKLPELLTTPFAEVATGFSETFLSLYPDYHPGFYYNHPNFSLSVLANPLTGAVSFAPEVVRYVRNWRPGSRFFRREMILEPDLTKTQEADNRYWCLFTYSSTQESLLRNLPKKVENEVRSLIWNTRLLKPEF